MLAREERGLRAAEVLGQQIGGAGAGEAFEAGHVVGLTWGGSDIRNLPRDWQPRLETERRAGTGACCALDLSGSV